MQELFPAVRLSLPARAQVHGSQRSQPHRLLDSQQWRPGDVIVLANQALARTAPHSGPPGQCPVRERLPLMPAPSQAGSGSPGAPDHSTGGFRAPVQLRCLEETDFRAGSEPRARPSGSRGAQQARL